MKETGLFGWENEWLAYDKAKKCFAEKRNKRAEKSEKI
jgi:hypothetical protein